MRRKHNKKIRHTYKSSTQTDITLQEFADASKALGGHSRVKKGAMYAIQTEVRSLKGASGFIEVRVKGVEKDLKDELKEEVKEEELTWFEKDIDDFDIENKTSEDESESCTVEETETQNTKIIAPTVKKCRLTGDDEGVVYPDDVWYRISNHIEPEAVGNFASICRTTYSITHTVHFWRQLYHRCCSSTSTLPDCLQPESLERVHGLRQRVIRALYHTYPPFVERTVMSRPFENEPYHLVGKRCIFMWYERVKNVWNFNFKLKTERLSDLNKIVPIKSLIDGRNLYQSYCDIYDNEENDCYILQVTCQNFQNLTSVMGLILCNIYLKVGQAMRYHCLQLHFDTNLKEATNQSKHKMGDTVISLDPVLNLRIFPWWHPKYL